MLVQRKLQKQMELEEVCAYAGIMTLFGVERQGGSWYVSNTVWTAGGLVTISLFFTTLKC
jgi:hypothetical protein